MWPPPEQPEEPGQFWKDFVRETAPVFRKSTFEQLREFIAPTWQALVDGARYVDARLAEILAEVEPDVVVEDDVVGFPAILAGGRQWVRIVSCNPLEVKDPELPPTFSGLPSDDRSGWAGFREEYARQVGELQESFSAFCVERGAPPLPGLELIHESPWLNLTLYPAELDYARGRPLGPRWRNLETSVRATDAPWSPPEPDGRALVYLSLGSLGSADVALMKRLVGELAETSHRYVVSTGPQHSVRAAPGPRAPGRARPRAPRRRSRTSRRGARSPFRERAVRCRAGPRRSGARASACRTTCTRSSCCCRRA